MPRIRHFALAAIFCLLSVSAQAQTPSVSTINVTPDADKVRISAVGDVLDLRVAVSDEAGDIVFEGGPVAGDHLDWVTGDPQGHRIPAGTYTLTITYSTSSGKQRRRVEQVLVTEAVTSGADSSQQSPTPNAVGTISGEGTANRIAKFTGPNAIGNSVLTESAGKVGLNTTAPTHALTVFGGPAWTAGGWTGSIALPNLGAVGWAANSSGQRRGIGHSDTGLLFFRTASELGTTSSGSAYDLAISNEGNVGVGTLAPASRLTVNGTVQIIGTGNGIKFPDGSIQTTKAVSGSGSSLTGAGTAGSLVKFTGPSSLSTSVIKENGGNVGIGTESPAQRLHLSGVNSRVRLQSTSPDEWTTTEYVTNDRAWHTGVGGSQVSNDVKGKFYVYDETAQQFRMVIDTSGRVGIGTTNPGSKLTVVTTGTGSSGFGVFSTSPSGVGVFGKSTSGHGVSGTSDSNTGVHGTSFSGHGVYGKSTSNIGVLGGSYSDNGVHGSSYSGNGVYGTSNTGHAGYFQGKVKITYGLEVTAGGCTGCSPPSDRHLKANFSAVNPRLILDRLATIPIQTWNYKSEPESVRHIGPMAQDFRAAFNFGTDDRTLNTVDAQGVTMAAIQGLYQQNQELTRRVGQLQSEVTKLRRAVNQRRGRRR